LEKRELTTTTTMGGRNEGSTNAAVEAMSGARITNRLVSGAVVRARFETRRHARVAELGEEIVGKYGFVGVLLETKIKTNNRGKEYAMWTVGELRNGGAATTVSVFGEAFETHGREAKAGYIWAVLDAKFYQSRNVSVETPAQLLKIGTAADFAVCKATKRDGNPCTKAVNVSECRFCEFHVPMAVRDVANASRVMTGKRNAAGEFKAGLQKYGANLNPTKARESHMDRPGMGVASGAPPPSARAQKLLKQSNVHVPRAAFTSKSRPAAAAAATMCLDEEDFEFENDKAKLATLAKQHADSVAQRRADAERAKQRQAAERLKAAGLTLTKSDPNDTSVKKVSAPVRVASKPLPKALEAVGLQTVTVEQLERRLKAEIARRKELEAENEDLKRRLAQAATGGSSGANRLPMTDVSNLMKNAMGSSSLGGPKTAVKPNTAVSGASKTQQLFGCSAPSAIKSRFMGDAEEEDHDSMMKTMEALEERDQLANQLAMKRETKVKVFHCTTCKKKTRFFDAETCRAHRDAVKEVESIMRYFKCKGCNRTNTSFDALFPKNCERSGCTSVSFERVTAADVTAAAKPTKSDMESARGELASREAMAPRGVEHGFRLDTIRGD